ncbi:hypothetical protein [Nocardioides baculatus]|uniref:Uncharacterized protein n=1 Tax=Nocardioides baculatus TaxID=2801337 RepID=A0ABS1L3Q7_9ACTN|nr:hypothetical protein [Nocardioides baculatus]MBL0746326.1 hypothetical protein [Nocardioides baculatus]
MTIQHSPAPARSDVGTPAPTGSSPRHPYAVHGRVLTAGALAWSASMAFTGLNPDDTAGLVIQSLGAGLFQIGLFFLLRTLWRTRALGEGRLARGVLRVEAAAVALAIGSTFVDAIQVSDLSQPGWAALDAFWPLSMMGMFFIGIRIAVAGRWKGASRWWPMVAESWAVVTIPTLGIFGESAANVVACLHLVVGYAVLGVLVARKTD